MEFYLNGERLDITLEGEKTVGEVLRSFEKTAQENNCATIAIKIDGKKIEAEDFDKTAAQELRDDTRIVLTAVSQASVPQAVKKSADELSRPVGLLWD